jgi:hypothetical protein
MSRKIRPVISRPLPQHTGRLFECSRGAAGSPPRAQVSAGVAPMCALSRARASLSRARASLSRARLSRVIYYPLLTRRGVAVARAPPRRVCAVCPVGRRGRRATATGRGACRSLSAASRLAALAPRLPSLRLGRRSSHVGLRSGLLQQVVPRHHTSHTRSVARRPEMVSDTALAAPRARAVLHAPAVLTYRRMCDLWFMDHPSHSTSWNGIAARAALPGEAAAPASRFQRGRVVEARNAFRMCRASPQSSRQHQGAPSHRRGRAAPRLRTFPAPLAACSH